MEPVPKGTHINQICQKCPLERYCGNGPETDMLIDLKGGFCDELNAHPVLLKNPVQERTIFLKKTGPFQNSSEEEEWNEVLTIAKSWGWIQG